MKKVLSGVMLAVLMVCLTGVAFATTDTLQISSGGLTATIADNGSCVGTGCGGISGDLNPTVGTDSISGSINGWTLNIVSGTSHSPGLVPFGIDMTSLTASCTIADCTAGNSLDVQYSDIGFTSTPANFMTTYSATISGAGSTSESAFFSNLNTLFAETNLIGTVGPFSAPGSSGTAVGGPGSASPYSLTLDETFSGGSSSSFSVDGNVTQAVPEPGSLILMSSGGLLGLASLRRRKLLRS